MLSISGFMDGVIFVDKPRLLDVDTWQHRWRNICLVGQQAESRSGGGGTN